MPFAGPTTSSSLTNTVMSQPTCSKIERQVDARTVVERSRGFAHAVDLDRRLAQERRDPAHGQAADHEAGLVLDLAGKESVRRRIARRRRLAAHRRGERTLLRPRSPAAVEQGDLRSAVIVHVEAEAEAVTGLLDRADAQIVAVALQRKDRDSGGRIRRRAEHFGLQFLVHDGIAPVKVAACDHLSRGARDPQGPVIAKQRVVRRHIADEIAAGGKHARARSHRTGVRQRRHGLRWWGEACNAHCVLPAGASGACLCRRC